MKRSMWNVLLIAAIVLPVALFGCKGKAEKVSEEPKEGMVESTMPVSETTGKVEPAQTVATETIPPTAAAPEIAPKQLPATQVKGDRAKDIQKALKNAGFYEGAVDGKIGPKTKKAIEAFQKTKGLIADGKVGPKTWAELEKYLKE